MQDPFSYFQSQNTDSEANRNKILGPRNTILNFDYFSAQQFPSNGQNSQQIDTFQNFTGVHKLTPSSDPIFSDQKRKKQLRSIGEEFENSEYPQSVSSIDHSIHVGSTPPTTIQLFASSSNPEQQYAQSPLSAASMPQDAPHFYPFISASSLKDGRMGRNPHFPPTNYPVTKTINPPPNGFNEEINEEEIFAEEDIFYSDENPSESFEEDQMSFNQANNMIFNNMSTQMTNNMMHMTNNGNFGQPKQNRMIQTNFYASKSPQIDPFSPKQAMQQQQQNYQNYMSSQNPNLGSSAGSAFGTAGALVSNSPVFMSPTNGPNGFSFSLPARIDSSMGTSSSSLSPGTSMNLAGPMFNNNNSGSNNLANHVLRQHNLLPRFPNLDSPHNTPPSPMMTGYVEMMPDGSMSLTGTHMSMGATMNDMEYINATVGSVGSTGSGAFGSPTNGSGVLVGSMGSGTGSPISSNAKAMMSMNSNGQQQMMMANNKQALAALNLNNSLNNSNNSKTFTEHPLGEHPSRTLFVRNISSQLGDDELRAIFEQFGDIRSIYTQCKHRGFIMVSYYDIRHAKLAMKNLQNRRFPDGVNKRRIDIHYSIPKEHPSEKDMNQGTLVVFNLDPATTNEELKVIFGKFGEIKEIRETPNKSHHKFIEFYDVRYAERAMKSLNRTELHGKKIKIEPSRPGGVKRQQWGSMGPGVAQPNQQKIAGKYSGTLHNSSGMVDPNNLMQNDLEYNGNGPTNGNNYMGSSYSSTSSSLDGNFPDFSDYYINSLTNGGSYEFNNMNNLNSLNNLNNLNNGNQNPLTGSFEYNQQQLLQQQNYLMDTLQQQDLSFQNSNEDPTNDNDFDYTNVSFSSERMQQPQQQKMISEPTNKPPAPPIKRVSSLSSPSTASSMITQQIPFAQQQQQQTFHQTNNSKTPSANNSNILESYLVDSPQPSQVQSPSPQQISPPKVLVDQTSPETKTEIMKIGGMAITVQMQYVNTQEKPNASMSPNNSAQHPEPQFLSVTETSSTSTSSSSTPSISANGTPSSPLVGAPVSSASPNPSPANFGVFPKTKNNIKSIAKTILTNKQRNNANLNSSQSIGSFEEEDSLLDTSPSSGSSSPSSFNEKGTSQTPGNENSTKKKKKFSSNNDNSKKSNSQEKLNSDSSFRDADSPTSSKQFQLDVGKVFEGLDKRTTLMIKNIPNKYTQQMLLATLDERDFKEKYDFFYLPIDFKNKCNVGYAFINFADPKTIIDFVKTFDNKKWEKFNSEKVCNITYARIQGRNSLINHFKNSTLMENSMECKPIFKMQD